MEYNQLFLALSTVAMTTVGLILLAAFILSGVPKRRVIRAGAKMAGIVVFLLTGVLHAHPFAAYVFPLATGVFFLFIAPLLDSVARLNADKSQQQGDVWYTEGNIQGIALLVLMLGEYILLSWLDVIRF